MNDQEIAAFLRDQCRGKMNPLQLAIAGYVADDLPLTWAERRHFEAMKTQFAADLAHAGKVVAK